jgi:mRNA-degrading endonuclease RelE of RelBE toxin-antitoxin system
MSWTLRVAHRAAKALARVPAKDRQRLVAALGEMQTNPFAGDIVRVQGERHTWRRRIGSYRIFFEVSTERLEVDVLDIVRRTSTTY